MRKTLNPTENIYQQNQRQSVLDIEAQNHPGVMSHICGLLARRAYNMESIICTPKKDRRFSRICLLLNEDQRLPQLVKQIQKLKDVISVTSHNQDQPYFDRLSKLFKRYAEE